MTAFSPWSQSMQHRRRDPALRCVISGQVLTCCGTPPTEVPFSAREAIPIDGDGGESTRRTQSGVFLFGFDQDGDVRIGVLPDLEKSVVGSVGLRQIACKRVRSGEPQVR